MMQELTIDKGSMVAPDLLVSVRNGLPSVVRFFPEPVLDQILAVSPFFRGRITADMDFLRQAGNMTVEPIEVVIGNLIQDGKSSDYRSVMEAHNLYVNLATEAARRYPDDIPNSEWGILSRIGQALLRNRLIIEANGSEAIGISEMGEEDYARRLLRLKALQRLLRSAIHEGNSAEQGDLLIRLGREEGVLNDLYRGRAKEYKSFNPQEAQPKIDPASAGWVADMTPAERHGLGDK